MSILNLQVLEDTHGNAVSTLNELIDFVVILVYYNDDNVLGTTKGPRGLYVMNKHINGCTIPSNEYVRLAISISLVIR